MVLYTKSIEKHDEISTCEGRLEFGSLLLLELAKDVFAKFDFLLKMSSSNLCLQNLLTHKNSMHTKTTK